MLGVVIEPLTRSIIRPRSILLPSGSLKLHQDLVKPVHGSGSPAKPDCECGPHSESNRRRAPADVSEAELASNPDIYGEDPGAFCKPFSNPQRI